MGIHFSLASGRPFPLIQKIVENLELNSPMITDNGAVIVNNTGKILWEAVLPNDQAREILNIARKFGLTRASTDKNLPDNPDNISNDHKVRKISVHDISPEEADQLIEMASQKYKNIAFSKAASYKGEEFVDVYLSHSHATKQKAVMEYAQLLNIKTEEIIGIGDGYNDFPLLMACGLKIAMGNAVDELKAIADFVVPTVDEDGLAVMIEKFVL